MNSGTLAEQVQRILVGGNPTTETDLDEREVELVVKQKVDSVLQNYLFQLNKAERNVGFRIPREFLAKITLPLTTNKGTLPNKPLQMPKNKTVYEANISGSTCGADGQTLIPINNALGMFRKSEEADLGGYYGYQISGEEFCIVNAGSATISEVELYYIPSAESLDSDDELTIPSFLQDEVIEQTAKVFSPHVSIDRDNKQDNKQYNPKEYNNNGR